MTELERVVSRAKWGRGLFVGAISVICLAVAGAIIFAIVVNFQQEKKITRVEQSACAQAPSSKECQQVKRESDEAQSIADTCIAFWKVGYACPAPKNSTARRPKDPEDAALGPAISQGASDPATAVGGDDEPPAASSPGTSLPPSSNHGGDEKPPAQPNPAPTEPEEAPTPIPPPAGGEEGNGPGSSGAPGGGPVIEVPPLLPHTPPEKPVCAGRAVCVGL
jgi:hypothetical protein